jgi:aspartate kinase
MQVSKFGGASVKNAEAVKNLQKIVETFEKPQVIVISAMGKMTNAFEELVQFYFSENKEACIEQFHHIKEFHYNIVTSLFDDSNDSLLTPFFECLSQLESRLEQHPSMHFDYEYDQIVSFGEILSTRIISAWLNRMGVHNEWIDVRQVLKTDDLYRDANVNWDVTTRLMTEEFTFKNTPLYITQGFLGGTLSNISTTLGREGSDYTAAIIGFALNAEDVTVWKDVPGILNADPRIFPDAEKIDSLSYAETSELSYYGAQVIHPKTIKPLQNKQIPLFVKSFVDMNLKGTVIEQGSHRVVVPIFILKRNQVLLTLSPIDFSFITEENLSEILALFSQYHIRINLLQTSALNFTVCVDQKENFLFLMKKLKENHNVRYNSQVELLTIRDYTQQVIDEQLEGREVIDSQITRRNARFVIQKS